MGSTLALAKAGKKVDLEQRSAGASSSLSLFSSEFEGSSPDHGSTMDPVERDRIFTDLFVREFRLVCNRLRRSGIGEDDIEDVAHDAFLTAYRLLPECDRLDLLRPWLYRIVHFAALALRKRRRHTPLVDGEGEYDAVDNAPLPDTQLDEARAKDIVARAMERMDASYRVLIQMHHIDERRVQDIADFLGVSLNTSYSRVRRARLELELVMRSLIQESAQARLRIQSAPASKQG